MSPGKVANQVSQSLSSSQEAYPRFCRTSCFRATFSRQVSEQSPTEQRARAYVVSVTYKSQYIVHQQARIGNRSILERNLRESLHREAKGQHGPRSEATSRLSSFWLCAKQQAPSPRQSVPWATPQLPHPCARRISRVYLDSATVSGVLFRVGPVPE